MPNVVYAFTDEPAAQRAAERLVAAGFAGDAVHVHQPNAAPRNAFGVSLDEFASGGFFHNFHKLFEDLFQSSALRRKPAETYDEMVKSEVAGLSVQADDDAAAERARALLAEAGGRNMTNTPPDENH